jgi:hypothetical protein
MMKTVYREQGSGISVERPPGDWRVNSGTEKQRDSDTEKQRCRKTERQ